ncbi:MAG: SWIM zinc finger domain-containing protein [Acidobacteria bacterium]|nr:SWIM zinc finger domain-containing protein [Acidobacteriota bacterium]
MDWTTERIIALAPDAASAKSGQVLATTRKWLLLGCHERAAWGLCQGSGREPYQTQIDLTEPAFRCTCPSRKFPCKHALGLFLLLASQPHAFTEKLPPTQVGEWLESRAKRAHQRLEKHTRAEQQSDSVADRGAQAKRAAAREVRVAAGLQELELWLRDLIRSGLAAVQTQPPAFWERAAARLVDAQAPGVARMVRELSGISSSGDGWQARLLERMSRIQLVIEGFNRFGELPIGTQADIRTIIGWTQNQDDLLSTEGFRDRWLVLGQRIEEEDRLRVQRTWLLGEAANRPAMLLHFAAGNQPLDAGVVAGTMIDAELVFFPGAYPLRVLIKQRYASPVQLDQMSGYTSIREASSAYVGALAHNPWIEEFPIALRDVIPVRRGGDWFARDSEASLLPLAPRSAHLWTLLALSGGREIELFGEWNGQHLWPLSAIAEGRFVQFL